MGLLNFIACVLGSEKALKKANRATLSSLNKKITALRREEYAKKYRQRQKYDRYANYLLSDRWKRKRQKVLKRDKHRCVHCGARATQVHHTQYAERRGTEP